MAEFNKPWVYKPRTAEDRIAELTDKLESQMWTILRLKEKNTDLKLKLDAYESLVRIIDDQHEIIRSYGKIFILQEAELKKLRGQTDASRTD